MKNRMIDTAVLTLLSMTMSLAMVGHSATAGEYNYHQGEYDHYHSLDCPYGDHSAFRSHLQHAVSEDTTDLNNPMWAVLVNRSGEVCMVAFSGESYDSQLLVSRQIAAAKAFTANGLSIVQDGVIEALDTRDIDALVQPGGALYGLAFGNSLDPAAAYKGPASLWGTQWDPMVGKRVGGTITFGGGVAAIRDGASIVGALGISGDSVERDHAIAVRLRDLLNLAPPTP